MQRKPKLQSCKAAIMHAVVPAVQCTQHQQQTTPTQKLSSTYQTPMVPYNRSPVCINGYHSMRLDKSNSVLDVPENPKVILLSAASLRQDTSHTSTVLALQVPLAFRRRRNHGNARCRTPR
jgi:hypothetical protein